MSESNNYLAEAMPLIVPRSTLTLGLSPPFHQILPSVSTKIDIREGGSA